MRVCLPEGLNDGFLLLWPVLGEHLLHEAEGCNVSKVHAVLEGDLCCAGGKQHLNVRQQLRQVAPTHKVSHPFQLRTLRINRKVGWERQIT